MTRGLGGKSPANVSYYLKGIDFPANKKTVLEHARRNGAPLVVLDTVQKMPDQQYKDVADVMKGYGEEREAAHAS